MAMRKFKIKCFYPSTIVIRQRIGLVEMIHWGRVYFRMIYLINNKNQIAIRSPRASFFNSCLLLFFCLMAYHRIASCFVLRNVTTPTVRNLFRLISNMDRFLMDRSFHV